MKTLQYYKKGEKIILQSGVDPDQRLATLFNNIGAIYTDKNNIDSASFYLKKGLKLSMDYFSKKSITTAEAYSSLGLLAMSQNKFTEAKINLEEALSIRQSIGGPES